MAIHCVLQLSTVDCSCKPPALSQAAAVCAVVQLRMRASLLDLSADVIALLLPHWSLATCQAAACTCSSLHAAFRDALDTAAALLPPLRRVFAQGRLAAAEYQQQKASPAGQRSDRMDQYAAMATKRAQFSAISRELNQIFFDFPFAVPEYFALITRALIVLEGIALSGDPSFDIFKAAYPHGLRRARELFGVEGLARVAAAAGRARIARPASDAEATPIARRRLTTV